MRNVLRLTVAIGVLAAPAVAHAEGAPQSNVPAEGQKEKKVCQRVVVTGSNMPKRVCRSASEQAAVEKANARRTADYINEKNSRGGLAAGTGEPKGK